MGLFGVERDLWLVAEERVERALMRGVDSPMEEKIKRQVTSSLFERGDDYFVYFSKFAEALSEEGFYSFVVTLANCPNPLKDVTYKNLEDYNNVLAGASEEELRFLVKTMIRQRALIPVEELRERSV